jgi:DNA-binding transcriptional LysR family regulator
MRMTAFEDLALLRAFVRVIESGSISAAARTLGLTQPTLSRYIQTLEERSGSQLLYRDTHRMHLTHAGYQLLEDAKSLLSLAEEAAQRLSSDHTGLRGHIRLFSTIDFGQSVVSRLLVGFIQSNPGVTVDLAYSNRPLHMIEEGCDAGIVAGEITDDTLIARPVGQIRRFVVASPALINAHKPVARPSELQSWPWLILAGTQFDGGQHVSLYGKGKKEHQLNVSPVLTSEGVTSLRESATLGLGVAVLPEWLIAEDLVSGRLVRVLPQWFARDLPAHIVYPVQRRVPLRVRAIIDFAAAYIGSVLAAKT